MMQNDGKKPDNVTLISWKRERTFVWDCHMYDCYKKFSLKKFLASSTFSRKIKIQQTFVAFSVKNFSAFNRNVKELFMNFKNQVLFAPQIISNKELATSLRTSSKNFSLEDVFYVF